MKLRDAKSKQFNGCTIPMQPHYMMYDGTWSTEEVMILSP